MKFNNQVRAGSAWLLAACVAMFAALVSLPTPASAQPVPHTACERVPFAAFYAMSVEGITVDRLAACLDGTAQPTNRVFASWTEAPRLLRHLRGIDARLLSGVTRESIPSPGQVALANFSALHARCDPAESESSDAGATNDASDAAVADAEPTSGAAVENQNAEAADAGAPTVHRRRAHLSRHAMRAHPWDPSTWFSGAECAGHRSIEIRPGDVIAVLTNVVRNDTFVADATARLVDPAQRPQIPALVAGVRTRLADQSGDPIPASLYPPLAGAALATLASLPAACFTAAGNGSAATVADPDTVEQLRLARVDNRRLRGENGALRGSLRQARESADTLRELPNKLFGAIVGLIILFGLFASWAFGSNEKLKKKLKEANKLLLTHSEQRGQAYASGEAHGRREIFRLAALQGRVESGDTSLPAVMPWVDVEGRISAIDQVQGAALLGAISRARSEERALVEGQVMAALEATHQRAPCPPEIGDFATRVHGFVAAKLASVAAAWQERYDRAVSDLEASHAQEIARLQAAGGGTLPGVGAGPVMAVQTAVHLVALAQDIFGRLPANHPLTPVAGPEDPSFGSNALDAFKALMATTEEIFTDLQTKLEGVTSSCERLQSELVSKTSQLDSLGIITREMSEERNEIGTALIGLCAYADGIGSGQPNQADTTRAALAIPRAIDNADMTRWLGSLREKIALLAGRLTSRPSTESAHTPSFATGHDPEETRRVSAINPARDMCQEGRVTSRGMGAAVMPVEAPTDEKPVLGDFDTLTEETAHDAETPPPGSRPSPTK